MRSVACVVYCGTSRSREVSQGGWRPQRGDQRDRTRETASCSSREPTAAAGERRHRPTVLRLLHLPLLRGRGVPARLQLPSAAAGRLHSRERHCEGWRIHPTTSIPRNQRVRSQCAYLPRRLALRGGTHPAADGFLGGWCLGNELGTDVRGVRLPSRAGAGPGTLRILQYLVAQTQEWVDANGDGVYQPSGAYFLRRGGAPPRGIRNRALPTFPWVRSM